MTRIEYINSLTVDQLRKLVTDLSDYMMDTECLVYDNGEAEYEDGEACDCGFYDPESGDRYL